MSERNVVVFDTETTGLDPKTAEIVELGASCLDANMVFEFLVKPSHPIPPEVSAVHHITDEDVADAASWGFVRDTFLAFVGEAPILVAHNVAFDRGFLGEIEGADWVCTYKAALRVWPDAPNHKNETLRYWLELGDRGRKSAQGSHSALHDAQVTRLILQELLINGTTIEEMIEWTKEPGQLPKMPMGKHVGQAWDTVPAQYLEWCIKQVDMRDDVVHCAKKELARRKASYATSGHR